MNGIAATLNDPSLELGIPFATDGSVVFGKPNDMNSREGRLLAHIFGHQPSDQQYRGSAWTHLQAIPAGERTYDLRRIEDLRDFLSDLEDGNLDGKSEKKGFQGVSVTAEGKVLVGDKAYDLTKPGDLHALLRDNADGHLDGTIGGPTDSVDPPHESTSQPQTISPLGSFLPGDFFPVGFPAPAAPADAPATTRGKPNNVMYDGETFDVGTEEGRDALEERLEAEGIDYDKTTNEVTVGDRVYDLDTEKGRRGFLFDAKDGLMDGKFGDSARNIVYEGKSYDTKTEKGRKALEKAIEGFGVEYDRASNKVKVGGKSYDLDTEKGRKAFQNDLKDGVLDGQAAKPPKEQTFRERVQQLAVLRPTVWTTPDPFIDASFRFVPQRA